MTAGASRETTGVQRRLRGTINRREIPAGLALSGAAVITISLINWAIPPRGAAIDYLITIGLGLLFVAAAAVLRSERVPTGVLPWAWIVLANVLVALLLLQYFLDPRPVNLLWVVAVTVTFLPVVGDWAAAWVGAGVSLAMTVWALWAWAVPDAVEYVLVATSAVTIGLLLLRRKLATIAALAEAEEAVEDRARTDPLTGVLNRRGLLERLDPLAAVAHRTQRGLFVAFVDVRGLKAANDAHGHDFGDTVILAVASALQSCVRAADVLGRWGGDEFVVVGLGAAQEPDVLEERVQRVIVSGGIDTSRWDAGVTVGVAEGDPFEIAPTELIRRADQAMYARRRGDAAR